MAQQGQETADYNSAAHMLTVHIVDGVSTANDVIRGNPGRHRVQRRFGVVLDRSSDSTNDGSGTVTAQTTFTTGGAAAVLPGPTPIRRKQRASSIPCCD